MIALLKLLRIYECILPIELAFVIDCMVTVTQFEHFVCPLVIAVPKLTIPRPFHFYVGWPITLKENVRVSGSPINRERFEAFVEFPRYRFVRNRVLSNTLYDFRRAARHFFIFISRLFYVSLRRGFCAKALGKALRLSTDKPPRSRRGLTSRASGPGS